MEKRTILIKTTSKGEVEITARIYCSKPIMEARLNGKSVGNATSAIIARSGLPTGCTHTVCGIVCLTDAETETLRSNWEAYVAEHNEQPEQKAAKLREQRGAIILKINSAKEEASHLRNRGWESGEGTGEWVGAGAEWEAKAEAARAELEAFDAEHPEVIAKIRAEKEEEHKRFMAAD